jgi:hypothetical protein
MIFPEVETRVVVAKLLTHFVATAVALVMTLVAIVDSVWTVSCETIARPRANWINSGTLRWPLASTGQLPRDGTLARLAIPQKLSRRSAALDAGAGKRSGPTC